MAFLKLDGTVTPYEGEALLDYIKLFLLTPNGAAFCNVSFGYKNLDESSADSVRTAINEALHMSNGSIQLDSVVKNSNSTITAHFIGTDKTLTIDNPGDSI